VDEPGIVLSVRQRPVYLGRRCINERMEFEPGAVGSFFTFFRRKKILRRCPIDLWLPGACWEQQRERENQTTRNTRPSHRSSNLWDLPGHYRGYRRLAQKLLGAKPRCGCGC